ncbi:YeeE/YedE family protein [Notoacmeibacter sp. MSK16QG-6]|uniref:YeeE/YedE family protein n=1 Tax=Notoacmeibacter sp. MSK16QG-6 TaxID=2957982 RepID=UPI0020A1C4FB|nr:YeeE/YedE family protein [Notoacmeibacter sp. MSK16QG-6]MCP1198487.1 YeeE/YedE family protein [Notoacmeibacter sp. MSK16QG-6]
MPTDFTPWLSLGGGVLIGLSAVFLMAFNGRIAGMTSILSILVKPRDWADQPWKFAFLAAAIAAPLVLFMSGYDIAVQVPASAPLLVIGGLLVGIGTMLGSGCTSGHGVCGNARLSPRSMAATATFLGFAVVTVFMIRLITGA